jgi:NAD(P)-dependent dehydrogenase (short-subunit alcohol dehydrogenase family)
VSSHGYDKLFSVEGKVVVITGGAGLLGSEIARGFAESDAEVIISDIDVSKAKAVADGLGRRARAERLDITDPQSVASLVEKSPRIDVWINAAYPRTRDWGNRFEDVSLESWRANVDMQLNGYFLCCQQAAAKMKTAGSGVIINTGSIYGIVGPRFDIYDGTQMTMPAAYSAIKGGLISFTRYLATYLAKHNIRVNAVCPGGIFDSQPESFVRAYERNTPLGRMGRPDDVVGPMIFLASDASKYITGQVVMVDGGWTAW